MTTKTHDLCVFIGRFQPLHAGHLALIEHARAQGSRVLVLVGSADQPRSFDNPFTTSERIDMVRSVLGEAPDIAVSCVRDSLYKPGTGDRDLDQWAQAVRNEAKAAWERFRAEDPSLAPDPSIALVGHEKDASSFYLRMFPEWGRVLMPAQHDGLSATQVRHALFGATAFQGIVSDKSNAKVPSRDVFPLLARSHATSALDGGFVLPPGSLPEPVSRWLRQFLHTEDYASMCMEYHHVLCTRHSWSQSPYPPIYSTADAVVMRGNQVLMVRRNGYPGRGLWAVPGGFVDQGEKVRAAALRELSEEIRLGLPREQIDAMVKGYCLFDDPRRSSRGRTITHAFLVELDPKMPLPGMRRDEEEVQDVKMIDIRELDPSQCFEDHYSIIHSMQALR